MGACEGLDCSVDQHVALQVPELRESSFAYAAHVVATCVVDCRKIITIQKRVGDLVEITE